MLGCVPDAEGLDKPAMYDFERLFKSQLLSGEQHRMEHYSRNELG